VIGYWSRAVGSDPKPQTSLYFWAMGLDKRGDQNGAIAQLRRALETDPAHELSENLWAGILERQGKLTEALEHCRTAVEIFPEFRAAHESCARILSRLGRQAEAQDHLERARRSDPNTSRRYVYWARFLLKKARTEAAVAELERALRANPNDQEARQLLAETRGAAPVAALDGRQRAALLRELAAEPKGTPVWFAVDQQDAAAREFGRALQAAFGEAGWAVRGVGKVPFAWHPGVFLFAADPQPPAYVQTAHQALKLAGVAPRLATDYRAYYAEMTRTKPGWHGFEMAADQTYLIVIGPTTPRP